MATLPTIGRSPRFRSWTVVLVLFSLLVVSACDSGGSNQDSSSTSPPADDGGGNDGGGDDGNDGSTTSLDNDVSVRFNAKSTKAKSNATGRLEVTFLYADEFDFCFNSVTLDDPLPVEKEIMPANCSYSSPSGIYVSFIPDRGASVENLELDILKDDGSVRQSASSLYGMLVSELGTVSDGISTPGWVGEWRLDDSTPDDPSTGQDDERTWDLDYNITETEWVQVTVMNDGRCGISKFSLDEIQTYTDGNDENWVVTASLTQADGLLYNSDETGTNTHTIEITEGGPSNLFYNFDAGTTPSYFGLDEPLRAEEANAANPVETDLSARSDCTQ